jgi:hypothetical protein
MLIQGKEEDKVMKEAKEEECEGDRSEVPE